MKGAQRGHLSTAAQAVEESECPVGIVASAMSMSLDGFVGGTGNQEWPVHERLHGWKFESASFRQRIGLDDGEHTIDSEILEEEIASSGAYVMGRNMFNAGEVPWGDEPPFRAPVFVVTHNAREPLVRQGGTTFTFVTDGAESAVRQAQAVAGDKNVFISGGASIV